MRIIRSLLAGLALTAVVVAGALPSTTAAFTDAAGATGNTLTTGSLAATAVDATTAQPSATSLDVAWSAASVTGTSLAPTYTVERSATADGANPTTVYTGGDTQVTDAGGGAAEVADIPFVSVSGGADHTIALTEEGVVYTWGRNNYGQLGDGGGQNSAVPVRLEPSLFGGQKVTAISAGGWHNMALTADGALYTWGWDAWGQLGMGGGSGQNVRVPARVAPGYFGQRPIATIAAGRNHSLAVTTDGVVYTWGSNQVGQLGTTTSFDFSRRPLQLAAQNFGGQKVVAVSGGQDHSLALTADGVVFAWGLGTSGQIGIGGTASAQTPVSIGAWPFGGQKVATIAAGSTHSLAVTTGGELYTWGGNTRGQLGVGTTERSLVPVRVEQSAFVGRQITAVAAGADLSMAVTDDGVLYAWGGGALGRPASSETGSALVPEEVGADLFGGERIAAVGAGPSHLATVTESGRVYAWGLSQYGQVGDGAFSLRRSPFHVAVTAPPTCPTGATTLADGSCSLVPDTTYYYRVSYTLGNWSAPASAWTPLTTVLAALTPSLADGATSTSLNVTWPATSTSSTYTLERSASADGAEPTTVYTGTDTTATDTGNFPAEAAAIPFASVAAGELHTIALTKDGEVYTWGNNWRGQLGNRTRTASSTPVRLAPSLFDGHKIVAVAAGEYHSVALADDGRVWAWGYGERGQLGNDYTFDRLLPVPVSTGWLGERKITAIAAGGEHTVALTENGGVYTWGSNSSGQLGNNSRLDAPFPVLVSAAQFGGRRVTAIAAGKSHTVIAVEGGRLFAWGGGAHGQLGFGGTADSPTPLSVFMNPFGGQQVVSLAAGETHTVALTAEGDLYAWGEGIYGQLGNGSSADRWHPMPVDASGFGGKKISAVAAGEFHTTAVATDGTVFSWGRNDHVQLGHDALFMSMRPATVNGLRLDGRKVVGVAGGQSHTVAVTEDGGVFTWGSNAYGQLGNGTTEPEGLPTAFSAPTRVFCAEGAVLTGDRCSLTPDTTYYYRVTYTNGDRTGPASAWVPLRTMEP